MTRIATHTDATRRITGWLVLAMMPCISAGCTGPAAPEPSGSSGVLVLYEDDPLANVQIRLHDVQDGPVLAQSITGIDGRAVFDDLPSPEPERYVVSIESVSDGGWILDARVIERGLGTIELTSFAEQPDQQITLPRRSVKIL